MPGTRAGSRLRVLFLTCHLPYPPFSGGRRREFELLRRLGPRVAIDLVAVTKTAEQDRRNAPRLKTLCRSVRVVPAEPESCPAGARQVRRHACPALGEEIAERLADVDLLHVEGFYLMQHVPDDCPVPVVLVEQNVEYQLCRQRAAIARELPQALDLLGDLRETRAAEIDAWRRSDVVGVLTEDDRRELLTAAADVDVRLVPDGVDHPTAWAGGNGAVPELGHPSLVFVGNFAYEPNLDAARYLCTAVFPRIAEQVPDARLALVGTSPPPELRRLAAERDIRVTGRVPAVEPYLDEADVVVAPLRVGGGVKVKVLEALRRGKPIVATSIAAQGLGPDAATAMRVADDAETFAAAAVGLLRDPAERMRLGVAAANLAEGLPTWDDAAAALLGCYRQAADTALGPVSESTLLSG